MSKKYCFDEKSPKDIYDIVKWMNIGKTYFEGIFMENVDIKNVSIINIDRDNIKITYDIPIFTKEDSMFCFFRTITFKLRRDRKFIDSLYLPITSQSKGFHKVRDFLAAELQIKHTNIQLISSSIIIDTFSMTDRLYISKRILLSGDDTTARVRKIKIEELLK